MYVDSPNGALLAETDVLGTVGHYKLRIPTDKHTLSFHSSPGEPLTTDITLINTGLSNLSPCQVCNLYDEVSSLLNYTLN